jgi:glycosyltransferase involved in cell wall biosynthesis
MKILVLTYLFPYPPDGGSKLRAYNTIRQLARDNEVTLVCTEHREVEANHLRHMESICNNILLARKTSLPLTHKVFRYARAVFSSIPLVMISSRDREKIALISRTLKEGKYDVIIAGHLMSGHLLYQCPDLPGSKCVRAIVNENVEYDLYKTMNSRRPSLLRPYYLLQSMILRRYERKVNEAFDLSVMMSEEDKRMFMALSPKLNACVLPNGVDQSYFSLRKSLPSNHDFYYAGSLNYYPNIDAIRFFMEEIFNLVKRKVDDCRFFIVGGNPPPEVIRYHDGTNVIVTGYLDDIRELVYKCRASVVPLRMGSGTRLKIVEAMSMGVPVVSTRKGAEGLELCDGREIFLADEAFSFADCLVRLLTDDSSARRLVDNAHVLIERKYHWERISDHLLKALEASRCA